MVFSFDEFYKHLSLKVIYQPDDWQDDNGNWVYPDEQVIYNGPIPIGKTEWEPEWEPDPDPEYGEDGRLFYVGEGEWTLVIWTKESIK